MAKSHKKRREKLSWKKTEMGLEAGPGLCLHASVLQLEWETYGDGSLTLVLSPHFKEPLINSLFWAYFFVKFFVFIRAILYYMWYNNLEVMIYVCCNQWCWQL